jgi:outer membrane immunogenic protein
MEKNVSTCLASVAALVAGSGSVAAQDWTGFYAGLSVNSNSGSSPVQMDEEDYQMNGDAVVGGFAGYRWSASGNVVMGVEIAMQGTIDLDAPPDEVPVEDGYAFGKMVDAKLSLGVPVGKALIYGFAGMSSGEMTNGYDEVYAASGANYGVGINYPVSERVIVGMEYISRNMPGYADDGFPESQSNANTVSLRASFKF